MEKRERESADACQRFMNIAKHGAKGLVKCTYSLVEGVATMEWSWKMNNENKIWGKIITACVLKTFEIGRVDQGADIRGRAG